MKNLFNLLLSKFGISGRKLLRQGKCNLNIRYRDGTRKHMEFYPSDYKREFPYANILNHKDDMVIIHHPDGDIVIPECELSGINYQIGSGLAPDGCTSNSWFDNSVAEEDKMRKAYTQVGVNIMI